MPNLRDDINISPQSGNHGQFLEISFHKHWYILIVLQRLNHKLAYTDSVAEFSLGIGICGVLLQRLNNVLVNAVPQACSTVTNVGML